MARAEFDKIDLLLGGLFLMSSAVTVGIAQVTLFETSWGTTASIGPLSLQLASFISLAVLTIAYLTNENTSVSDLDRFYRGAVLATVVLTLGVPTIPVIRDTVAASDLAAISVLVVEVLGYAAIAYIK